MNRNYFWIVLVASVTFLCLTVAETAVGNLISNGGFESGTVPFNLGATGHGQVPAPWSSYVPGNTFVSYDTWANSGSPDGLIPSFNLVWSGVTAIEGNRWTGGWNYESMGQTLSNSLVPGATYTVSAYLRVAALSGASTYGQADFYLTDNLDFNSATKSLLWTSPQVTTNDGWMLVSGSFVAPANSAALPIFMPKFSTTGATNVYMGIDQISLVPEPLTCELAALGLAALAVAGRRRWQRWTCRRMHA